MERWNGKIAVVTGASSGIGAATVIDLLKTGLTVVALDIQGDRLKEFQERVNGLKLTGQLYTQVCDITSEESVKSTFAWIEKNLKGVNILVNCAGVFPYTTILGDSDSLPKIKKTIDTNLFGLIQVTKAAFDILQKTGDIGHIVNVSSIGGHFVPFVCFPGESTRHHVYAGTKFAIRATTEVLRQELIHLNKNVKISQISPGSVKTSLLINGNFENADEILKKMVRMNPEDISAGIMYILGTPPHVQVHDLIIRTVGETY